MPKHCNTARRKNKIEIGIDKNFFLFYHESHMIQKAKSAFDKFGSLIVPALYLGSVYIVGAQQTVKVQEGAGGLGFAIPDLSLLLTFLIRVFFAIAGLAALLYLLLGALAWITSGGSKEGVDKARDKIEAAIIGLIVIVAVLSLMWTMEQVVFNKSLCFGISCNLTLPVLLK